MDGKKYIFLGDSITCADRFWHPGPYELGCGYVSMLAEKLKEKDAAATVINKGYDGFTLPFLLRNLEEDCITKQPDAVCILIGINDIGIYKNTGRSLEEQNFAENYRCLIRQIHEKTAAKILCIGPFIFPHPDEYKTWIPDVKTVEAICRQTAMESGAEFLCCHDMLNNIAKREGASAVTADGIHLTEKGHQYLAEMIWTQFLQKT